MELRSKSSLDSFWEALNEAREIRDERDILKERVKNLEERLSHRDPREEAIDKILARLDTIEDTPGPVGPLVEACVSVLEAAKVLLEHCQRRL